MGKEERATGGERGGGEGGEKGKEAREREGKTASQTSREERTRMRAGKQYETQNEGMRAGDKDVKVNNIFAIKDLKFIHGLYWGIHMYSHMYIYTYKSQT